MPSPSRDLDGRLVGAAIPVITSCWLEKLELLDLVILTV
jgi:hypothetical protein